MSIYKLRNDPSFLKSKEKRKDNQQESIIKSNIDNWFLSIVVVVTCIKIMLIPSYYSTDLEVHRNWMAITYHKPLSEWYLDETSPWTLDYPPFFAYFEFVMGRLAALIDDRMLRLQSDSYMSLSTLYFLRFTVIVSDLVYYYATYCWILILFRNQSKMINNNPNNLFIPIVLFEMNVGHLLVDHIHFQYNGFLNGLMLLAMACLYNGQIYWSSFWFSVLLNFKHIYLYIAPAFFFHLFFRYCLQISNEKPFFKIRYQILVKLASIVLGVFLISFGPFFNQIDQVIGRLFPFQRGLSHAYWAPNFWALYNSFDLFMAKFLLKKNSLSASYTTGLVQQSQHLILPSISPRFSLVCVLSIILVIACLYLWRVLREKKIKSISMDHGTEFLLLCLLSTMTFYQFGYHVHEKAVLLIVPVMIPLILSNVDYARIFLVFSSVAYFSLFPLLFRPAETLIKILLLLTHVIFVFDSFQYSTIGKTKSTSSKKLIENFKLPKISLFESLYLYGFLAIQAVQSFGSTIMPRIFERYEFLPLALISLYCSFGFAFYYIKLFSHFVSQ